MELRFEKYGDYLTRIPEKGNHILAFTSQDEIVVYQAYRHETADYAVTHQRFGGLTYSYNRMSWIKPNFLWMMFRCGWATKVGQERVLAIWIKQHFFEQILEEAAYSSFQSNIYSNREEWQDHLERSEVRLQWDPDHDPYGVKQERKAIQLGLKGDVLKMFGTSAIVRIEDISVFVREQRVKVEANAMNELLVPVENVFSPSSERLRAFLNI